MLRGVFGELEFMSYHIKSDERHGSAKDSSCK